MRRFLIISILIVAAVLLCTGCATTTLVVPDSEQVHYVDQGQAVTAPWPAVLLSRGYYAKLKQAEMRLKAEGESRP